ncbi:FG-GAP repeat protein [Streptomyces sp. NPDC007000]|uniref:FG-GAP repeat protein n=1 Tax=Streptomyces sp. NPDC007000 TaxID=3155357 RepID=UPI0033D45B23
MAVGGADGDGCADLAVRAHGEDVDAQRNTVSVLLLEGRGKRERPACGGLRTLHPGPPGPPGCPGHTRHGRERHHRARRPVRQGRPARGRHP